MVILTEYARKRESRRFWNVGIWSGFEILVMTSLSISAFRGGRRLLWLVVLVAVMAMYCACLVISVLIPVHPSHLVPLREHPIGTWRAQLRARSFESVVSLRPRMSEYTVLPGLVTFEEDGGVSWTIHGSNRRVFGEIGKDWPRDSEIAARRLRGTGHQVHLAIQNPSDPQEGVIDLWLRGAKNFPI